MSWTNYHSHCRYCDGKGEPEVFAQRAIELGLDAYGFSSHGPVPFETTWNMRAEDVTHYLSEIHQLREKYRDQIQLYCGMEVDFVPGLISVQHGIVREAGLDYTIGSIHFVDAYADGTPWEIDGPHEGFLRGLHEIFEGDVKRAVRRYFELTRQMIREAPPSVVGHVDKIKMQNEGGTLFSEEDGWYQDEVAETLRTIADARLTVEVNTRGLYKKKTEETYPSRWILERMWAMDIPVMLNSDAHRPNEITAYFEEAALLLQDVGYTHVQILYDGRWQSVPLKTRINA
ncbi:histidinol-phosphatase (PHP family) [Catalinimonas alkaloidigena]|uniref:Histidinol-phosphatase n=1 Tax=Catalinimonas alkaloidigena TaxID=1075417 RepID=A0A1G9NH80_9BACT|nr:histidinol-phosphatase [Catalinimonas alkaloidigena]SDL85734.1 histidinol-phosphatase (PHP family) [Catalinimonas alkaloidigena]